MDAQSIEHVEWLAEERARLIMQNEKLRKLLADVVLCMPGYAGCGDISREQRVFGELEAVLGEDMPRRMGA